MVLSFESGVQCPMSIHVAMGICISTKNSVGHLQRFIVIHKTEGLPLQTAKIIVIQSIRIIFFLVMIPNQIHSKEI